MNDILITFYDFHNYYFVILLVFIFLIYNMIVLYKRKRINIFFTTIRISIILLILLLMINPLLKFKYYHIVNNRVNVFIDNSISMSKHIENNNINLENLYKEITNKVKNNVDVIYYIFGDSIRSIDNLNIIDFNDTQSNFSDLLH